MTSGSSIQVMIRTATPQAGQVSSGTSLCPTASRQPTAVQIGFPADLSISIPKIRLRRCAQNLPRTRLRGHRGAAFGRYLLLRIAPHRVPASPSPLGRCHSRAVFAVRREHSMKASREVAICSAPPEFQAVVSLLHALHLKRQPAAVPADCRRHVTGGLPITRLNARANAASES